MSSFVPIWKIIFDHMETFRNNSLHWLSQSFEQCSPLYHQSILSERFHILFDLLRSRFPVAISCPKWGSIEINLFIQTELFDCNFCREQHAGPVSPISRIPKLAGSSTIPPTATALRNTGKIHPPILICNSGFFLDIRKKTLGEKYSKLKEKTQNSSLKAKTQA